jgi:hypothetical protein
MADQSDVTSDSSTGNNDTSTDDNQTQNDTSSGSEVVNNSDEERDKSVPYDRFHEVNEAKKQYEDRARKAEEELEKLREESRPQENETENEIEPDVEKLLDSYAKKKGFVSQNELQVQSDIQDLKQEYAKSDTPFDDKAIYDYAKKNSVPIPASKAAWRALYRDMNYDSILEAERKRAVTDYREGAKNTAERPGSGGAKAPSEQKHVDRKSRIHAAAQKILGG